MKNRWIPQNARTMHSAPEGLGVVYVYTDPKGRSCAIAYAGKRSKSSWHHAFANEQQMLEKAAEFFLNLKSWKATKAEWRATRMRPQVQWTLTSFGNNAAAVIRKRGGGRTGRPRQHRRKRINLPGAVMVERTPPPNDAPPSLGLSILEVKDGVCRYPYGERFPYTFCGHPTDKGDVYCPFHQALTCTPVRPLPVVWIKHAEAT